MKMFTHEKPVFFNHGTKIPNKKTGGKQLFKSFLLLMAFVFSSSIVFGQLTINNVFQTNPTGCSANDGQIIIIASGGTAPYEFSIDGGTTYSSGASPFSFTLLSGGEYNVQVRDNVGTVEVWGANPIVLYNEDGISIQGSNTIDASCYGESDGSVQVVVDYGNSGPTNPFTFELFLGAASQGTNTTGIFSGLAAGTYSVKVTNDACNVTESGLVVDQPAEIQIATSVNDASCNGDSDGSITATASDGNPPYTYVLKDNGGSIIASNSTGIFTGLAGGNYTVEATDTEPCTNSVAVSVGNPSVLNFDLVDATDITCFGNGDGEIDITVSGGTGPYTYYLNRGDVSEQNNLTGIFTGLSQGDYNVSIEDDNGCTLVYTSNPVTINEPTELSITSVTSNDVSGCNGDASGSIDIVATGGTSPLQYSINNGSTWQLGLGSFGSLTAGSYDIVVKDDNNCSVTYASNPVVITEPTVVSISNVSKNDETCVGAADGDVTITAGGGTGDLFYSVVPTGNPPSYGAANVNVVTGLSAGTYDVQVKDANDCATAIQSITLNVADVTPPTAVCQDITVQLDASGAVSITAAQIDNGSSDNCAIASMTLSQYDFDCTDVGANSVTLTVTDTKGLTDNCVATVTVEDNIDPTAVCQDINLDLDATGNASIVAADIDNGSSDACGILSLSASQTAFTCADLGANTVTLTVTDNNGNTSTCNATVTVNDVTDPIANCVAGPITISLDASGQASITAASLDDGSTDACGPLSFSASQTDFDCNDIGANVVTLTVEDGSGNSSTCDVTVNVEDNIPPVASCQDFDLHLDASGNGTLLASDIDNGSSDNCSLNYSLSQSAFTCADLGPQSVTLTVTDPGGNSDNCVATVTVIDDTPPNAVCQDITVQLDASGNATISGADIDGGSTDNCGILFMTATPNGFSCIDVGVQTVTLTVYDEQFNSSTCTANVTVEDPILPTAVCQDISVNLNASGFASIAAADLDGGSSDNCAISFSASQILFDCSDVGVVPVTLTVTDDAGNTDDCVANVTVNDVENPVAVCQDIDVYLDATGNATIAAEDLDGGSTDNCDLSFSASQTSFTCADIGVVPVTLTVTDAGGNTDDCIANVTVHDDEAPIATCQDFTAQLDASGSVTVLPGDIDNGSSDACGIASMTIDGGASVTYGCADVGTHTVTLEVIDNNGNSSTCTSTVTVEDNISPSASCLTSSASGAQLFGSIPASESITGITSDGAGNIYAVTSNCARIYKIEPDETTTLWASGLQSAFNANDLQFADGYIYCAKYSNGLYRVPITNPASETSQGTLSGVLWALAYYNNNMYVAAGPIFGSPSIYEVDIATGTTTLYLQPSDGLPPRISGMTFSSDGKLYLADNNGKNIHEFVGSTGSATSSIVLSGFSGNTTDIEQDASGNFYVAVKNEGIKKYNSSFVYDSDLPGGTAINDWNLATSLGEIVFSKNNSNDVYILSAGGAGFTAELDASGSVTVLPSDIDDGSSDNCGIDSYTINGAASVTYGCADVGNQTVTLTVTDASGNSDFCVSTISVEDNIDPVASCQDFTAELDASGSVTVLPSDIDDGSSDACGIASLTIDGGASVTYGCADIGTHTVTLEVTDNNGNSSTCTATVTVEDNLDPTAICQDITVQLDGSGNASIVAADINNGSSDNCGIASLSISPSVFDCSNIGANTVVLTVTDNNGNTSTCSSTVTVEDNIAPTANCVAGPINVNLDASGSATIEVADINNGSTDNCGIADMSLDITSFDCSDVGAPVTVTLTVTDGSGNSSQCTTDVNVFDVTAPTAICQNISVDLDGSGNATITASQIDNGSYDECSAVSLSLDQTSFTCADIGPNTVTLTVTDASLNSSTCTATVTVNDNTDPTITCGADINQANDPGVCNAVVAVPAPVTNDNCSVATVTNSFNGTSDASDTYPVGTTTVTWTVTDSNGNSATCDQDITVDDTENPSVTCVAGPVNVNLDATGNATITVADIELSSSDNCAIVNKSLDISSFDCSDIGAPIAVTLTVTDAAGNSDFCSTNVNVLDVTAPTAICQDISIDLDNTGNASIVAADIDNGSFDECSAVSLSLSQTAFTCADIGANTVTLTVTDASLNSSTCIATVTVNDNEAPSAVCAPFTAQLDASGSVTITGADVDGGSSDNCGIASLDVTPNTFDCSDIATSPHTVTLTVTDASGNTDQCTTTVSVEDNVDPVVQCVSNPTFYLDATGNLFLTTADIDDGSSDNCGIASMSLSQQLFSCADVGSVSITLTVTDVNGNSDFCVTNATIVDDTDPVAVCQDITVPLDVTGNASITGNDIDNGSSDACGVASVTASPNSFTCADVGPNTVTLTVTDVNGNSSTCTSTVTIVDTQNPTAVCNDITIQLDANGDASIVAGDIDGGSNDNCNFSLSASQTDFTCADVGPNNVTLTVTDDSGNTDDCVAVVTVEDNIAPTANCQNFTAQLDNTGNVLITAADIDNGSSDNCGIASMSVSPNLFSCADVGTGPHNVTLTVTDVNGNVSTCTSDVTVEDNIAPVVTCPADDEIFIGAGCQIALPDYSGSLTASDACGVASAVQSPAAGTILTDADAGANTVTFTVTDVNGNVETCSFTVTVTDDMAITSVDVDVTDISCNGLNDGEIVINATGGGAGDLYYSIDNGSSFGAANANTFSGLSAGSYDIVVKNDNDCEVAYSGNSVTITEPTALSILAVLHQPPLCNGGSDGEILVLAMGGHGTYEYSIDNGSTWQSSNQFTGLTAGFYDVWVRDAAFPSCDLYYGVPYEVTEPPALQIDNVVINDVTCFGDTDGDITINASGGSGDLYFSVGAVGDLPSYGLANDNFFDNLAAGDYDIYVSDAHSCELGPVTYTISVGDVTPPTVITQDITVSLDATGNVSITAAQVDNGSSDNCAIVDMTVAPNSFTCADIGANTVTLTVEDSNGNTANGTATVTVEDNMAPTFTAPADITIYRDAACTYDADPSNTGDVTDEDDNCSVGEATYSDVVDNTDPCAVVITRTWSLVDDEGNAAADQDQIITVEDNTPPTFTAPADITIYRDAACAYDASIAVTGDVTDEDDNCGVGEATYSDVVDNTDPCAVVITRTWSLVDDCGNPAADQDQIITVEDNTAPTFTAPADITIYRDAACAYDADPSNTGDVTDEDDNCGVGEATYSDVVDNTDPCAVVITRTWSLVDDCGNPAADQDQIITVEDNTAPTFTAPADITIYRDAACAYDASIAVTGDVTDEDDNCGVGEATYSDVVDNTDPCAVVITRTWSLVDDCGNPAADQDQIITVEDNTPPTFTAPADITIYRDATCAYDASIAVTGDVTDEDDNCGVGEATYSDVVDNTDPCAVVITRTWSLVDDCGNPAADQDQIITVEDNTAPTFTAPADITIYRDAACAYDADPSNTGDVTDEDDNCGVGEATYSDVVDNTDPCAVVITRTWSLVDDCGNPAADQDQIITVEDNTAPTFTAPADITIYRDAACAYDADPSNTGDVTDEDDNCGVGEATYSDVVDNTDPCAVVITRTWSLVDDCGNPAADQDQIITVEDNTAPTFTAPADITIYRDATCAYDASIAVTGDVTDEADNCGVGEATYSDVVDNTDPCAVVITRTWSLVDDCGNTTNQDQIITVEDNTAPTFTAPADITIYKDGNCTYDADPTNTGDVTDEDDNCGVGEATYSDVVDNTDPCVVTITRTWSLVDDCGNSAVDQIQIISVEDNTPPVAVCQDISIDLDANGMASIVPSDIDGGSSDNCGFTLSASQLDFDCSHVGANTVTLTVTDDCGNTATCDATVTVNDVTAPDITCPADQDLYIGAGCEVALPDYSSMLIADDACGIATIEQDPVPGTMYTGNDVGTYTVEYTVTDSNGNVSTCSFNVNVSDQEAFTIDDVQYTNVQCNGANDGTITVLTTGGPSGLFYSIDGVDYSNTTGVFTGLAPDTYSVSVMNTNDCMTYWGDITITEPTPLVIDDVVATNVTGCFGNTNASIEILASGGTPTYEYSIDNQATWSTSNFFDNLAAGDYDIFVRDANGCVTGWGTTIHVNEPAPVLLVDVDVVHVTGCYGDLTGEIHIEASGGTGTLSYSIDGGATFFENEGHFTGLAAGFYNIVIMDENGCDYIAPSPTVINQPAKLIVNDVMVTDVTECYGNTNGALDISAVGGTGTILYSIDGGSTFVDNGGLFENLAGGDYNVFITDDNGCIGEYDMNPVTIGQPVQITMTVSSGDVNGCAGNDDGFISIIATGGTGVYTYSIDGGNTWSSSADFTGLAAGSYEVWTQDDLGCMQPYSGNPVVITEPDQIVYNEVLVTDLGCYGAGDGEIFVEGAGGTGLLMYSINGGATYQTNGSFTELAAGEYNLFIMDDNGCVVAYENNPVVVGQPNEIVVSDVVVQNESCSGSLGSITVTASGGAGGLMYSINDGVTYQSGNVFGALPADTYVVKVKDADGCEQYYPGNPVVVLDLNPSTVVINANPGTEVCTGTNVTLSANAFEAVNYEWSTGETGSEIVVNETTPGIYDYTCYVVNEDGCESEETISIEFVAGSEITIVADPGTEVLVGQTVTLEAIVDDAISYLWQPGGLEDPIIQVTSDEVGTIEYTVTVINSAGCETTASIEITYGPVAIPELESDIMSINVYPNPNSGEFSLELVGISQEVEISVIDFAGRLILEEKILDITADKMEKQFDLGDYERGVYFLRITHGGKVSYKKVVIQ